ncbi:FAD-binding oxidoreductase [Nocardioides gansuensis]|uniref:FAD-binding oxidoreductase n=1 Tax=Nocardioides gansuensis TaxID=2138300 RepID=A0A2T8F4J5_9ACTN|nr:FAD-binding oxidoreductase [Nocardioides gansuensis]PVG80628.1 FAD-binding oxidoreductase [Nocardioides gansuensis]
MTIDAFAIHPGDPEYDAARTTIAGTASPVVVLRPRDSAEVALSIRHAIEGQLPLAVRSGGHNALNFGNVDEGVVVDLSGLHGVELLGGGRVRVGAGATWGHVARSLQPHGLGISSGDTVSVGVGGLTQAGGIGWLVRKHGLTIDSLLAAEVVTAAGEVVRASHDEHPDLFWALRGGAGNFGVVTAFEFQAQPVGSIRFGTISYQLEDLPQLLKGWAEAMQTAPDELTTTLVLMPGFGDFPAGATLYVADSGDDASVLEPLRAIGTVLSENIAEKSYAEVLEDAYPPQGVLPVIGNTLVESVDDGLVAAVAEAYGQGGRVVFLRSLGGAFGRVAPEATAFAHRSAEALVVSAAFLPLDATAEQVEAARAVWRTIGDQGIGVYAGFLGSDTEEDVAALWPAEPRRRLVEAKRAWDPDNTFRRNFNVVP